MCIRDSCSGEAGPRSRARLHVTVPREVPEPLSPHGTAVPGASGPRARPWMRLDVAVLGAVAGPLV
eukprot:2592176-Alexandrium_andersonii.AAC.1